MKTREEVSAEKLRGGFYTPPTLVHHVRRRLAELGDAASGRLLEPSAGDGAFFCPLEGNEPRPNEIIGIELNPREAMKAQAQLLDSGLAGSVLNTSTLTWVNSNQGEKFDAAIGNLPFVRFQFLSAADRAACESISLRLGVRISGVSNLWIPMLFATLERVREGGSFSLILPTECFTGVSAGIAREWLVANSDELEVDLFPAKSFPGALQEVLVVSGRVVRSSGRERRLSVHQWTDALRGTPALINSTSHRISPSRESWTKYLLDREHFEAYLEFSSLASVSPLLNLARLEVSTVTGANEFFSLNESRMRTLHLEPWGRRLLAKSRHATGLEFREEDWESARTLGLPCFLFDYSLRPIDRHEDIFLDDYLKTGEELGINSRFKCRTRFPWWKIPSIKPSTLMLSKRSHSYPRLVLNKTDAITTDTIYRGTMVSGKSSEALVSSFHNSGTLLSAELEGRSFGGGVLELVPSEIARLLTPYEVSMASALPLLDSVARNGSPIQLIEATNAELSRRQPEIDSSLLARLEEGRIALAQRRFGRN